MLYGLPLDEEIIAARKRAACPNEFHQNGSSYHLRDLSREGEKTLIHPDGSLSHSGSRIRANQSRLNIAPEFPECVVEPQIVGIERRENFLEDYWHSNFDARDAVSEIAKMFSLQVLESGSAYYQPSDLLDYDNWMVKEYIRFTAIIDSLSALFGKQHEVVFNYLRGDCEKINVPTHPVLALGLAQDSLNVGFAPAFSGLYFDFFQGPCQLISALFSNSAILGSRLGARYNNRLYLWRKAMSRDGSMTPYSIGSYTEQKDVRVLESYLDFVYRNGEEILTFEQAGKVTENLSPWPHLKLLSGTLWTISCRLQWKHDDSGKIVLWQEVRSLDAQPTAGMSLAVELAMIGLALYWIKKKGIESVTEVMSHDNAKISFEEILKKGSRAAIPGRKSPDALNWFIYEVHDQAIEGLLSDKVCSEEFATSAMDLLYDSLLNGTTGTDWIRKKVRTFEREGHSEQDACRKALAYLSKVQMNQPRSFGAFEEQGLNYLEPCF